MTAEIEVATLDSSDADALWLAWFSADNEDILARSAFERILRDMAGLADDGLFFRPGGWSVDLPATLARATCAAAILAALFELAGLHDVDREIIISTASLLASMDLRPVRLGRQERHLADRLRQKGMVDIPISAEQARLSLPKERRRGVDSDQIEEYMDRLVAAGFADHVGEDQWILRAEGSEAWFRLHLGRRLT